MHDMQEIWTLVYHDVSLTSVVHCLQQDQERTSDDGPGRRTANAGVSHGWFSTSAAPDEQEKGRSEHLAARVSAQGEDGSAHAFLEIVGEQAEGVVDRVVNVAAGLEVTPKADLANCVERLPLHHKHCKIKCLLFTKTHALPL